MFYKHLLLLLLLMLQVEVKAVNFKRTSLAQSLWQQRSGLLAFILLHECFCTLNDDKMDPCEVPSE